MGDFYFFTDIDLLNPQDPSKAYGPAGVVGNNERFRVTSIHTATGSPRAYAICAGTVCIQQDKNNNALVNLILKPSQRPIINFPTIKYFIYKGILKSSLQDGNGKIVVNPTNKLTASIIASWAAFLVSINLPIVSAPIKSLGIDLDATVANFSDTDLIDNLFYRDNITYQFINVKGGWIMGDFDAAQFGLEIITENVGYEPKLILTRNNENFVKVQQIGNEPSAIFKYWHDKEEILNFIDPCAFYGSFYADKVYAKTFNGAFSKMSENEIYDKILKGSHHTAASTGNFYNRNFVFLDIRNEHNQSINYYKNYGVSLNISLDGGPVASTNYYSHNWPILILNSSGNPLFPPGNTSSKSVISLNLPKGDNELPIVYISQGYRNKINPFKRELNGKRKFIEPTVPTNHTSAIELATPNRDGNSNTTIISCLIKIRYFKKLNRRIGDPPVSSGTVIRSTDFMDSVFAAFNMKIPFPFSSGVPKVRVKVYNEEIYIDWLKDRGIDFVADIGIAEDANNITLFAFAKDIHQNPRFFRTHDKISFNSETSNIADFFLNFVDDHEKLNKLAEMDLTLNSLTPSKIQVLKMIPDGPSFIEKFTLPDYENHFVCIVLDKANYASIKTSALTAGLGNLSDDYKIFIGVANRNDRDTPTSNDQSNDSPPIKYLSYDVLVKGFSIDSLGNISATEYTPLDSKSTTFKIYN